MAVLLVEGPSDVALVRQLLEQAGVEDLEILPAGGIAKMGKLASALQREAQPVGVLVDADGFGVLDTQRKVRARLGTGSVRVFCATPEIEAWLLADPNALPQALPRPGDGLPLVDEIAHPKQLVRQYFGRRSPSRGLPTGYSLARALEYSPSLRSFVAGVQEMVGGNSKSPADTTLKPKYSAPLRRALVGLLRETYPGNAILWRTASGDHTAADVVQMLNDGTPAGDQYLASILGISTELLRRQSREARVP